MNQPLRETISYRFCREFADGSVYALMRPDPAPAVFGYHEVFHAMVIVAALLQYAVITF